MMFTVIERLWEWGEKNISNFRMTHQIAFEIVRLAIEFSTDEYCYNTSC